MLKVEIRDAMDSAIPTGFFTLGGVLLGFMLTHMASFFEQKRENARKLQLFNKKLKMLSIIVTLLPGRIEEKREYYEIRSYYEEFNAPMKLKELTELLPSIDFKDGDDLEIYTDFDVLRHGFERLKNVFLVYDDLREPETTEQFYLDLDTVCKGITDVMTRLGANVEAISRKERSFFEKLKSMCRTLCRKETE